MEPVACAVRKSSGLNIFLLNLWEGECLGDKGVF
jgi:hypothetical protein